MGRHDRHTDTQTSDEWVGKTDTQTSDEWVGKTDTQTSDEWVDLQTQTDSRVDSRHRQGMQLKY